MLDNLYTQYTQASHRLFLLDYDGTLAEFQPTPEEAVTSPKTFAVLKRLANDEKNTVVVLSGRDSVSLGTWLGKLPIFLAAEYGALTKRPKGHWHTVSPRDDAWKRPVRSLLQEYNVMVPGSFTEEKLYALVWHYRQADPLDAAKAYKSLRHQLEPLAKKLQLELMPGSKALEVRCATVDKGTTTRDWLQLAHWDFVCAVGDDISDEAMFEALPPNAFTIKIGRQATVARDRLPSPKRFIQLLENLSGGDERT